MECPQCGHINDDDDKFCSNCGARLQGGAAIPRQFAQPALSQIRTEIGDERLFPCENRSLLGVADHLAEPGCPIVRIAVADGLLTAWGVAGTGLKRVIAANATAKNLFDNAMEKLITVVGGTLNTLTGHIAVGHCRYSTTGASTWQNAQPTFRPTADGSIALGHNGNLINTSALAEMVAELPSDEGELDIHARNLEAATNDTYGGHRPGDCAVARSPPRRSEAGRSIRRAPKSR